MRNSRCLRERKDESNQKVQGSIHRVTFILCVEFSLISKMKLNRSVSGPRFQMVNLNGYHSFTSVVESPELFRFSVFEMLYENCHAYLRSFS